MQTSGLLRLLDRNRAQGSRALREGKGPAQRARPEEVVHVPSGGTARTNHSRHTWEDKARALPLTRPFGRSCDFGGRSCSKIMKLLLKVEAAGIEPASESTRPGRTTCLARAFRHPGADHGQPAPGPSPNESRPAPSGRHTGPADFFGGTDRRHRLGSGIPRTSDRARRRVRSQRCRWLLWLCPSFEEVTCTLCMRSRLRCPRRNRFAPKANPAGAECPRGCRNNITGRNGWSSYPAPPRLTSASAFEIARLPTRRAQCCSTCCGRHMGGTA